MDELPKRLALLGRRGIFRYIWLSSVLVVVVVAGLTVLHTLEVRELYLSQAESRAQILADVTTSDVEGILTGVDNIFFGINELISRRQQLAGFERQLDNSLAAWYRANPYLMDLLVLNPQGVISHWTGSGDPPSVLDREYVTHHLENPNSRETFIGRPKRSKVHYDKWFFAMSRSYTDAENNLTHILVAVIEIEQLYKSLFSRIQQQGVTTLLLNSEGDIYLRIPEHEKYVGQQAGKEEERRFDADGRLTLRVLSPLDNTRLVVGMKKSSRYPLVAIASLSEAQLLERWRYEALINFSAALLSLTFLLLLIYQLFLQQRHLFQLSTHDGMTTLYNRSGFMELAEKEYARSVRYQLPLALVMADIDDFKQVNDTFGHKAGDEVLRGVAQELIANGRGSDVISRYGGEEFMVMLVNTDYEDAAQVAEKLRQVVEGLVFDEFQLSVTMSFGVTQLDAEDMGLDAMLRRVDQALYVSKQAGKNRVSVELANPVSEG